MQLALYGGPYDQRTIRVLRPGSAVAVLVGDVPQPVTLDQFETAVALGTDSAGRAQAIRRAAENCRVALYTRSAGLGWLDRIRRRPRPYAFVRYGRLVAEDTYLGPQLRLDVRCSPE